MMALADGAIVVLRHRRAIPVATVTALDTFTALRLYGIGETIAAAVAARIITIRLIA